MRKLTVLLIILATPAFADGPAPGSPAAGVLIHDHCVAFNWQSDQAGPAAPGSAVAVIRAYVGAVCDIARRTRGLSMGGFSLPNRVPYGAVSPAWIDSNRDLLSALAGRGQQ